MLKCGNHRNRHIQEDFDAYGIDSFSFEYIESTDDECRYVREQFWMDVYCEAGRLYNILPIAGSAAGRIHFGETKRKMSESAKGRVISAEQREKLAIANKGKKATEEARAKMSASLKARKAWGSKSPGARLTETEAVGIISRLQNGELQKDVAKIYGVSNSTVSHVWLGTTWPHLERRQSDIIPRSKLTEDDVREILIRFRDGEYGTKIADDYGISTAAAYQIKNRKSWKHVEINEEAAHVGA